MGFRLLSGRSWKKPASLFFYWTPKNITAVFSFLKLLLQTNCLHLGYNAGCNGVLHRVFILSVHMDREPRFRWVWCDLGECCFPALTRKWVPAIEVS